MASEKLKVLKEYIEAQACDQALWCFSETVSEAYIQEELRRVAWLIEKASVAQIRIEIELLIDRMP